MGNNYIIPSLDRALEIIGFLATQPKGCGITTIADKMGYPKNSVFRILKTLASKGYIIESDKLYQLSAKFLAVGYSAVGEAHMVEKAIDVMRELRDEVNETVLLGTLVGNRGVILEQVLSTQPLKVMVDPGHNFALHTAAPAKAMLAYMNPEDQGKIIDSITYTRFNENTIITKGHFIKNLKEVQGERLCYRSGRRNYQSALRGLPDFQSQTGADRCDLDHRTFRPPAAGAI